MVRFTGMFLLLATANSFTLQSPQKVQSTQLYDQTKQPPTVAALVKASYGEESRKYRRTVYTHDDWVGHRSPDRFARNILTTTSSGVYKSVGREVGATTSIATFICLWNMAAGGYTDLDGVAHEAIMQSQFLPALSLPLASFTLVTPFIGLLLGQLPEMI
jgi:putative membrane protein